MKKLFALILAMIIIAVPLCVRAESPAPEMLSAAWSDEEDGFLITFRKNGLEGEYHLISFYGEADDPRYGSGMRSIEPENSEPVEYILHSGDLIPGETYTFLISVTLPDGQEVRSAGKSASVPVTGAQSPIRIYECSVPDLSRSALEHMREMLIGYLIEGDMEGYMAACEEYYRSTVTASFRTSGLVRVLLIAPDGNRTSFIAGNCPEYPEHEQYYALDTRLADQFTAPVTIMNGQYTLRMYDWERKCLIGTYYFNVV